MSGEHVGARDHCVAVSLACSLPSASEWGLIFPRQLAVDIMRHASTACRILILAGNNSLCRSWPAAQHSTLCRDRGGAVHTGSICRCHPLYRCSALPRTHACHHVRTGTPTRSARSSQPPTSATSATVCLALTRTAWHHTMSWCWTWRTGWKHVSGLLPS